MDSIVRRGGRHGATPPCHPARYQHRARADFLGDALVPELRAPQFRPPLGRKDGRCDPGSLGNPWESGRARQACHRNSGVEPSAASESLGWNRDAVSDEEDDAEDRRADASSQQDRHKGQKAEVDICNVGFVRCAVAHTEKAP